MKGYVKRTSVRSVLALGALAVLVGFQGAQKASAQSTFASSIMGTVQDSKGATVAGVTLTLTNLDKNTTQTMTSDAAGAYVALNLIPGSYEIVATKYGFANANARITLDARRQLRTDLKLAPAAVNEGAGKSALAKELEAMKERIAQLEAEMNKKDDQPTTLLATTTKDASELPRLPGRE
jgi:hypothetical protein